MKSALSLAVLFTITFSSFTFSQSASIRGMIVDDLSDESIPFADIYVEGTNVGTNTDFDGLYELKLEPGVYTLVASFLGYADYKIEALQLAEGETAVVEIRLKEENELLEEVVVVGKAIKNSESAVLALQKKSMQIVDGLSAQSLKRSGDGNAASAIRRVTGVSLDGGKYIFVRGLGDRYSKASVNGMDIPGLDPDRNSMQLDIFPSSMISNIMVSKSFTPDQSGDFVGGIVNITTKDYPDERNLDISASASYNPSMHFNSNFLRQNSSSTDFLGFDNGKRSLPFNARTPIPLAIQNPQSGAQLTALTKSFGTEMAPHRDRNFMNFGLGVNWGNQKVKEKVTMGYTASLNYRNTSQYYDEVISRNFQKDNESADSYDLDLARDQYGELATNTSQLSGLGLFSMKWKNTLASVSAMRIQEGTATNGKFTAEKFLDASNKIVRDNAEYTERSITQSSIIVEHELEDLGIKVEFRTGPSYSTINDKDVRISAFRLDDGKLSIQPSEGAVPRRIFRDLQEFSIPARLDGSWDFKIKEKPSKVKLGIANTLKMRDYGINEYVVRIQGQSEFDIEGDPNKLFQDENIWTFESGKGVYIEGDFQAANRFEAKQQIMAAYAMHEMPITSSFRAIYGMRIENFTHHYKGQNQRSEFINAQLINDTDILPSLNFIYSLKESMNIRLSGSKTLARPSFKEASNAEIYDAISDRLFVGNAELKTTDIWNADIRWELYRPQGEMFAVSAFYKDFTNPIEIVAYSEAAPNDITPRNVGSARVFGVEFEARKNLEFISNKLHHVNVGTNLTLVNSEVQLDDSPGGELDSRKRVARTGEIVEDTRQMQGQAPYVLNAYLSYINIDHGWQLNTSYNVQGRSLSVVGISLNPDVYTQPFHSLDLKVSKRLLNKPISFSLAARNILNSKREQYYSSFNASDEIYDFRAPGRTFSLGFNWDIK